MSNTGTLQVRVYTSEAQVPVEGATVVVTGTGERGKLELISVQATDRSGLVRPITIATPQTADSTSPDLSGNGRPFALCSVWAEHPGFAMLRVEGVQIFPGVVTEQNMELIPLEENESSLEQRGLREISGQNL